MNAHLSQDELLDQVYGIGAAAGHLQECAECSARFQALLRTKTQLREEADAGCQPSSAFFAAQRRAVYARLDRAAASYVRWAPALAGAGLLAIGLLLLPHGQVGSPHRAAPSAQTEMSGDDQLLSDLYSKEQSLEPSGAAPIHELFDAATGSGEQ